MTEKSIQEKLKKKFETHKYILCNSYVYDWESDFFSMNTSRYHQEVEIKLSYSDFKADFNKIDKHSIFKSRFEGTPPPIFKVGKTFVYSYEETTSLIIDGQRIRDGETGLVKQVGTGVIKTGTLRLNNPEIWGRERLNFKYEQISSEIELRQNPRCPNKFYYICPKGVIPLEEIPEYAGLFYINENFHITEIKKAPFIHKEHINLDKILLDKFYWKSVNLERKI